MRSCGYCHKRIDQKDRPNKLFCNRTCKRAAWGDGDAPPLRRACNAVDCQNILPLEARKSQRYCSVPCQRRMVAIRKRVTPPTRPCAWCRKGFIPKPRELFHSEECRIKARRKRAQDWRVKNREKHRKSSREYRRYVVASRQRRNPPKPRNCAWCGVEFTHVNPRTRFCKPEHFREHDKKKMRDRYRDDPDYRKKCRAQADQWHKDNPRKHRESQQRYDKKRSKAS
jgi:hypothetical protein